MAKPKAATRTTAPLVAPERSAGERSEPARSGGATNGARASGVDPDVEVLEKPSRRRFDAQYKLRILAEVDAGPPGGVGSVLRREGLYFSHLLTWRRQRDEGALAGLQPRQRGPKPKRPTSEGRRIAQLERENKQLQLQLAQARTIIEFQKKVHEILGIPLQEPPGNDAPS